MAIEVTTNNFKAGEDEDLDIKDLDINDITENSSPDDIEQVFENRRRGVTNELDDIRLTKRDLSLYSLRDRLNKMPTVAHTGEFKHLDHIPYIDINNDFTGYVPDKNDYKEGIYKGEPELQYCKRIEAVDETTHEERQIERMWKAKVDTTHNEFDDDFKSYEELNYGLIHLKDKFKIDNMWAYAHPEVTGYAIDDAKDTNFYRGDVDPNFRSTFVYFPHHIDEIYGMSNLGQMIIKSNEGEAALAKRGTYAAGDVYGEGEVTDGRNGLMSRKDKTDFDRINEILRTVPTGAHAQQVAYTGEFKHLNFTEIGLGEADGQYVDPETHAEFCAKLKSYLATPTLYNKDGSVNTHGTHGFMSESDRTIMHHHLNTGDPIGKNYPAHNYVHVTDPGYRHVPAGGRGIQILTFAGSSGDAKWDNRDTYIGDGKGITVSDKPVEKDAEGKREFTISPIFGPSDIKNDPIDITDTVKVAPGYHTHDERYVNTAGPDTMQGPLTVEDGFTSKSKIIGGSGLDITGNSIINGNLEVTGDFVTGGSFDIVEGINAGGNIHTNSNLEVAGTGNIGSSLTVGGSITSQERLTVNSGGFNVTGNSTINGTLDVTGNTEIVGKLEVTGENGNLKVIGNTDIGGDLDVAGSIKGDSLTTGECTIDKSGNIDTSGTITSGKKLTVESDGMKVIGNSEIIGKLDISSDTTIGGNLTVEGKINGGSAEITGTTVIGSGSNKVTVSSGDITMSGDITVSGGNAFIGSGSNYVDIDNGNITATGDITGKNITATETLKGKNLNITENATIGGTTTTTNLVVKESITAKDINASNSITTNELIAQKITVPGGIDGNASSASKLDHSVTINGTSTDFNENNSNITTRYWGTARNIYIADADGSNTGVAVSVNGDSNHTLKLPSKVKATLDGNASSASKLDHSVTINGTSVNFENSGNNSNITTANWGTARNIYISDNSGSNTGPAVSVNGGGNATLKLPTNITFSSITGSLSGNASTATTLQNARTLTIGNTGKSFNGSGNVSWSLAEIGAAAAKHRHTADELEIPTVDITKVYINGVPRTAKVNGNTLLFE